VWVYICVSFTQYNIKVKRNTANDWGLKICFVGFSWFFVVKMLYKAVCFSRWCTPNVERKQPETVVGMLAAVAPN